MSEDKEILALIKLLDDEDPFVYESVTNKLISYGPSIIPQLEHVWEDTFNPAIHERIEELIHQINFEHLYQQFENWVSSEHHSLRDGAILVARYHYPDLDEFEVMEQIERIRQKIWLEMHNDLTPLEQINIFNQIFYGIIGFNGSYTAKLDTPDFCINHVLSSKSGSSITLGIIYILIAQDLDMPVYGIRLYRHFILSYQKKFIQDFQLDHSADSVFYINAMNKGMIFPRNEIKDYLKNLEEPAITAYFTPADNVQIISELLLYLQHHFEDQEDTDKKQEMLRLRALLNQ